MLVPLLCLGLGLLLGYLLFSHPRPQHNEWSVTIAMNIVTGASYPLTVKLTRRGKPVDLPAGATVVWGESPVGTVTADENDQSRATLVAGAVGATGQVTAQVTFTANGATEPTTLNLASGDLDVVEGDPDGGGIELGAEL